MLKIVHQTGVEIEIPRDVEAQGGQAVDAYVSAHHAASAPPTPTGRRHRTPPADPPEELIHE
jgi:hypothetical protein